MKEVFVFGSNLAGRHGKGAALHARKYYGAEYGVAEGMTGRAYAIPTKDEGFQTLSLEKIKRYVDRFIEFAEFCAIAFPDCYFKVTRIGCGLARHKDIDIAPMFANAPDNCQLPDEWNLILDRV